MSQIYVIDAKKQSLVYEQLLGLARTHDDVDVIKGQKPSADPGSLSARDVYDNKTFSGIEIGLDAGGGKIGSVTVKNEDALKRIYDALRTRDTDHDGKIDATYLTEDLSVTFDGQRSIYSEEEIRQRIIDKYAGSVFAVKIVLKGPNPDGGQGTGFVLKRFDNGNGTYTYHVITNAHVADDKDYEEDHFDLVATDDTSRFERVRLVGVDPLADLAVLEFTTSMFLEECPLAKADPALNESVVEFGNTSGHGVKPLAGEIVDVNHGVPYFEYTDGDDYPFRLYEMRNITQPGNSGSPLFDADGNVVGVHNMNLGEELKGVIPADRVQKSYDNIIANRDTQGVVYADWGIYPEVINPEIRAALLPADISGSGVLVSRVFEGSAAERAGIKPGDIILNVSQNTEPTSIGDDDNMYRFHTAMLESAPGRKLKVAIYRPSDHNAITVSLVPDERSYGPMATYDTNYGFNVSDISEQERRIHDIPSDIQGVSTYLTARTSQGAPPIFNNLINSDIIMAVNGQATPDVVSFKVLFEKALLSGGDVILTTYKSALYYVSSNGGNGTVEYVVIPGEG